jgi:hypothetical protein
LDYGGLIPEDDENMRLEFEHGENKFRILANRGHAHRG